MTYRCELRHQVPQPTQVVRTRTPVTGLPGVIGRAYGLVMKRLTESGEYPSGMPFVVYHNMDMNDLDVEIGFPVARALPGIGEVESGELPGGEVVTCLHRGPYNDVGKAYDAITHWIEEHGYAHAGPIYEQYLNGPDEVPEAELETLVVVPVAPAMVRT